MWQRLQSVSLLVLLTSMGWVECRGAERVVFELRGTAIPENGISAIASQVSVQLHALSGPQSGKELSTIASAGGKFRFKRIRTGMYLLTVFIPRVARVRRTVEIGPSLANEKGLIEVNIRLTARRRRPGMFEVPANELSIPATARDEFEKGQQQLRDYNLERASEHFRRAASGAPQFFAAWYQMGAVAVRQERYREAEEFYRMALKLQPENYRALVALGEVLLALRDSQGAVSINAQAVNYRPDDPQAQVQLGFSLMLNDRLAEAETHLREAVLLDPANFNYPQLMLAEICRRRNDLPAVKRELEEFVRLHPDSPKANEIRSALSELLQIMKQSSANNTAATNP